jgi:hypothetical protein
MMGQVVASITAASGFTNLQVMLGRNLAPTFMEKPVETNLDGQFLCLVMVIG